MKRLGIGIMSGTSLDGIDVALASIEGYHEGTRVTLHHFNTYPLSDSLINRIRQAMEPKTSSVDLLCSLNFELGYAFAEAVQKLCQEARLPLSHLDFVASHGQTMYHMPNEPLPCHRSTLQLGEGSVIKEMLQTTVISNFRTADMAVGGQGAPLVPFADYVLFKSDTKTRVVHNIGGISNLTWLKKGGLPEDVMAFDTGPGNMMINDAIFRLLGLPYDDQGIHASLGTPIKPMLEALLSHPFLSQTPPKSTGRETFGSPWTHKLLKQYSDYAINDLLATFTAYTAISIADAYERYIFPLGPLDEIIFSGGGIHNTFLMNSIKARLHPIPIRTMEDYGMNSDAKEALAFLILGHHTLGHVTNHLPSTTGASRPVILGQIHPVLK